jgi:fumarate hydratase subunit beta
LKQINIPFEYDEALNGSLQLAAGDRVELTGFLYTARDAAHKRMYEALLAGESLPFDIAGQVIYYVGPTPPKPGHIIGSAGPTTSGRMDKYAPALIERGLKGMIGKGKRSSEVRVAMLQHKAYYFAAVGGAAALIAKTIRSSEMVAYPELGTEAIYRLFVEKFPCIVINDLDGRDLYQEGEDQFRIEV